MRLKFEDWEEWARHYEPIQTIHWDVHFTIPRSIEQIEVNYTINPTDGITVNNAIN